MEMNLWLGSIILICALIILCRVFWNYRKRTKLFTTTYRVKIDSEDESITLVTYKDINGSQKIWLYEKEWEKTIELPGCRQPSLMVSARYLGNTAGGNTGENNRPLVSGEIVYKGNILKEDNQRIITLEFPN